MFHISVPVSSLTDAAALLDAAEQLTKLAAAIGHTSVPATVVAEVVPEVPAAPVVAEVPAAPVPPAPAPVVVTELRPTAALEASGYTPDQYVESGWSEQQLIDAGYLELVEVPAPAPLAAAPVPPAPPAPGIAPTVPAATGATSTDSAVELDKRGFPWDSRIHSDAAERKTQQGVWKRKRGVSDELVAQVEAELQAVMSGKPLTAGPVPTVPSVPTAPAPAPATPSASAPAAPSDFPGLTAWLVPLINSSKLTQTDVTLAVQQAGLTMLPQLNGRPDLIPTVVAHINAKLGA